MKKINLSIFITIFLFVCKTSFSQQNVDEYNPPKLLSNDNSNNDSFQFDDESTNNTSNELQDFSLIVIKNLSQRKDKFKNFENNEAVLYLNGEKAVAGNYNVTICISLRQAAFHDFMVPLDYSAGTAINGVDFAKLPDYVTFSKGDQNQCLIVSLYINNKNVSEKTLKIRAKTSESAYKELTIKIKNYADLHANICNDLTIKKGEKATLSVTPSGGFEPYSYQWSKGLIKSPSITVTPKESSLYTVTITDNEGAVTKASVKVNVN